MMIRKLMSVALVTLFGAAVAVGCDEKLDEKKTVDVKKNGDVVTEKREVTEKADGSIEEKTSKEVDKADRDNVDADGDDDKEVKLKVDVDEK